MYLQQGSYQPSNSELLEYWVSKRDPDRLIGCEHSVVDFEIEGAKVKTNVLFEAATTANQLPNIFKDKKCADFEKLQEERFQQEARKNKPAGGSGGILGAIAGAAGAATGGGGGGGNRGGNGGRGGGNGRGGILGTIGNLLGGLGNRRG